MSDCFCFDLFCFFVIIDLCVLLPISIRYINILFFFVRGGTLWLESIPGCGSTFSFTITFDKVAGGGLMREPSSSSLVPASVTNRYVLVCVLCVHVCVLVMRLCVCLCICVSLLRWPHARAKQRVSGANLCCVRVRECVGVCLICACACEACASMCE